MIGFTGLAVVGGLIYYLLSSKETEVEEPESSEPKSELLVDLAEV